MMNEKNECRVMNEKKKKKTNKHRYKPHKHEIQK